MNFTVPSDYPVFRFGAKPNTLGHCGFLLHPDMSDHSFWPTLDRTVGPLVTPTSSARTVRVIGYDPVYIKLSYDQLIGRTPRQIGRKQAISAIEVSNVISAAIDDHRLTPRFRFMREIFAEVVAPTGAEEWGYVVRESEPYPMRDDETYLVPAFSLFAKDRKIPQDPLLLDQLLELNGGTPWEYVIDGLVRPLIEAHFALLKTCGLQLEPHAQNILFSFDKDYRPKSVVARDAESIDKDFGLIARHNLPVNFTELGYKCLRPNDYNYQIMHSFMFDFKMGEYLLEPLVEWLSKRCDIERAKIFSAIRDITNDNLTGLPPDFFPSSSWFCYANVVHDHATRREYVSCSDLKFR
jgi:hypothetical protein